MQKEPTFRVKPWSFIAISVLCILLLIYVAKTLYIPGYMGLEFSQSSFGMGYALQTKPILLFIPFFVIDVLIVSVSFSLLNSIWEGKSSAKFWISSGFSTLVMAYHYIYGYIGYSDPMAMPESQYMGIIQRVIIYGVSFSVISLAIVFCGYMIITKKRENPHIKASEKLPSRSL